VEHPEWRSGMNVANEDWQPMEIDEGHLLCNGFMSNGLIEKVKESHSSFQD
jgi:hypothetical protein